MQNKGEIIIYELPDGQTTIDVKLENDSIWLSLIQMSNLFGKDKSVISRHLKNIYNEAELEKMQLLQKMQQFKWKQIEAL